jgi:hypothetical protein
MPRRDQTQTPIGESAMEFIVRKRTKAEMEVGGCLVNARQVRASNPRITNQLIFNNLGRIRDARVSASSN